MKHTDHQIASYVKSGLTRRRIADLIGLSYPRTCARIQALGLRAVRDTQNMRHRHNPEEDRRIMEMRKQGMPLRAIGGAFGYSHEWIRKIIRRIETGNHTIR